MIRYKFTDLEIKKALKELTIIVDSREKSNAHIIAWLENKKINYKVQKLEQGDYSAFLPKGVLKGVDRDLYFDKLIVVERKANIDEICGNFSSGDYTRFAKEFAILKSNNIKVRLLIEDCLYHKHLRDGKFRSKYDPKTLHARIKGFEAEYNTIIEPVATDYIASEIYNTLYYAIRNYLLRDFSVEIEVDNYGSM